MWKKGEPVDVLAEILSLKTQVAGLRHDVQQLRAEKEEEGPAGARVAAALAERVPVIVAQSVVAARGL